MPDRPGPDGRGIQAIANEVICDGSKLVPVLERREFAVPVPSDRASGTVAGKPGRRVRDVTTLDSADQVDRQPITELWPAAKRMLDAGLSREAVLGRLARAATP